MRAKVERCQGVTSLENVPSKPSQNDSLHDGSVHQNSNWKRVTFFQLEGLSVKCFSLNHAGFKVATSSSRLINVSLWLFHSFKQTC